MKRLYIECDSGISGDMFVAALLDLGGDFQKLEQALKSLPLTGYRVEAKEVQKNAIRAMDFSVLLDEAYENHDHDMSYLFPEQETHSGHPAQEHAHGHTHAASEQGEHVHVHRGFLEVKQIIEAGSLTKRAKELSLKVFEVLAEAEAKAHGVSVEEVHFHEVGAVDSIVDIVSAAVLMDQLAIGEVVIPSLTEGCGTVRCAHGFLPIPVPAVLHILEQYQIPFTITQRKAELITPTGAAITAAFCTGHALPEKMKITKVGVGAGKRAYDPPSLLRAMFFEQEKDYDKDRIVKLETNLDDCTGEALGYVMERLFEAGARDVHYIPVYMKKNRPGYQLNVICEKSAVEALERIIFEETTTIGIRRVEMSRTILSRRMDTVRTSLGEVAVKEVMVEGKKRKYPEYESIRVICEKEHRSYQEVYDMVRKELS